MTSFFPIKWESPKENLCIQHNLFKRLFDIFFSLTVLILGSPIYLLIGLFVFITSPGPIFYGCRRMGRGKKIFYCLKFRTMVKNADQKLKSVLEKDKKLKAYWDKYQKLKKDPRVTKIGGFLRKTSLDELPQFYNVLKGDLSVVGPRPKFISQLEDHYANIPYKVLAVRPGITGPFQVSGRCTIIFKDRFAIEENYVENHNFFLDIIIILKTIPQMILHKGAY